MTIIGANGSPVLCVEPRQTHLAAEPPAQELALALQFARAEKSDARRLSRPIARGQWWAAAPDNLIGLRDRALLLMGFAAALPRSELVGLDVADLKQSKVGMRLRIRTSKTDQDRQSVSVAIAQVAAGARSLLSTSGWPPQASMTAQSFGQCSRAAGLPMRGCPIGRWRRSSKVMPRALASTRHRTADTACGPAFSPLPRNAGHPYSR
jgi:hypothetical protein